jgi:hypothetical protein
VNNLLSAPPISSSRKNILQCPPEKEHVDPRASQEFAEKRKIIFLTVTQTPFPGPCSPKLGQYSRKHPGFKAIEKSCIISKYRRKFP